MSAFVLKGMCTTIMSVNTCERGLSAFALKGLHTVFVLS
jgi:hypothetical protein